MRSGGNGHSLADPRCLALVQAGLLNSLKIRNRASPSSQANTGSGAIAPRSDTCLNAPNSTAVADTNSSGSVHDPAAVDAQQLPGDERAFRGAEEQHRVGDIARHAAPLDRLLVQDVAVVALAVRM